MQVGSSLGGGLFLLSHSFPCLSLVLPNLPQHQNYQIIQLGYVVGN